MKPEIKIKILTDFLMSLLLLCLMAYQIVGEMLHEWLGAGMLVLFIVHSVLNRKWYKNLFKGRYTPLRITDAVINIVLLAIMLCLGYSGIVMSRHVFAFLPIDGGMATARVLHLLTSYWGFVLMSFHIGLHFGMITGMIKKAFRITKSNKTVSVVSRVAVLLISAYGVYSFITEKIADNMFLKTQFAYFDFEASWVTIFGRYAAMMVLFAAIAYFTAKLLRKITKKTKEKTEA